MKVIETRAGRVQGIERDDVVVWRGIPFASPPVGPLRWKPPVPTVPWGGVRDCTRFSNRAMQPVQPEAFSLQPDPDAARDDPRAMSEDCLFLNVCAPNREPDDPRGFPVLLWIHGGGFHFGSGPVFVGEGDQFARSGVVVVTFNYRLGSLGFLHLAGLLGAEFTTSGTSGLQDQIAVLEWVRDNIGAFGGDASRVTIGGCSAGGKSVAALMGAPSAKGLFSRAISESGGQHVATAEVAHQQALELLKALNLKETQAGDLLSIPAHELVAAQALFGTDVKATFTWRPTVDGTVLPAAPLESIARGCASGVALLAGTNANEALTYDVPDPSAAEQSPRILAEIFGSESTRVLDLYRSRRPLSGERTAWQAVMSDERYGIQTLRLLDAQQTHASTWRYRFDCRGHVPEEMKGGHGTEMSFVFALALDQLDPDRRSVAMGMHASWVRFVHGLSPGADGLPDWPEYDTTRRATMIIDSPARVEYDPSAEERRVWDGKPLPETPWWQLLRHQTNR